MQFDTKAEDLFLIWYQNFTDKFLIYNHRNGTSLYGTVIGITQPPPIDGAWSALFSYLSKFGLDNYVVKRSAAGRAIHSPTLQIALETRF